jgi:hypothetical protein
MSYPTNKRQIVAVKYEVQNHDIDKKSIISPFAAGTFREFPVRLCSYEPSWSQEPVPKRNESTAAFEQVIARVERLAKSSAPVIAAIAHDPVDPVARLHTCQAPSQKLKWGFRSAIRLVVTSNHARWRVRRTARGT